MDILAMLKRRLGENYLTQEQFEDYIMIAEQIILQRRFGSLKSRPDTLPIQYQHTCFQISLYLINRDGSEGEMSHSVGGISRSYKNANVPEDLLVDVIPLVRAL